MKKIMQFLTNLSKNRKWNLFIIIAFLIFSILDYLAGNFIIGLLESFVVIMESVTFRENIKNK